MARGNRRGGRTVVALLALSALAGAAFLVGALAGLVWKEPSLLVAYLRGETTEVSWSTADSEVAPSGGEASEDPLAQEAGPTPSLPSVVETRRPPVRSLPPTAVAKTAPSTPPRALAPVPAPPPAKAAPIPKAAPKPVARPPAVAAAPPAARVGRVAIQVGAFAERTAADRLRGSLEADGYPAYVAAAAGGGSSHWRVRVGPYASRDEAANIAQILKRTHELPTWVLDEDAE